MISLKRKQSGFTIVELLIVIVVIGILAAIVIVTFTGVQKKARDSDRKSDINAINGLLEVYFADNSHYPLLTEVNDKAAGGWVENNMKDLKTDLTTAPGGTSDDMVSSGATTANYLYAPTDDAGGACDNSAADLCTKYTLSATLEQGGTFSKQSSN